MKQEIEEFIAHINKQLEQDLNPNTKAMLEMMRICLNLILRLDGRIEEINTKEHVKNLNML